MKVKEDDAQQLLHWACPDCDCDNTLFLFTGEELPEILECSFCNHVSDEITWEAEGGGGDSK